MTSISISEYPASRSWDTKVFAMPNIPRGDVGYQESLKYILTALKNNTPLNTLAKISGSKRKVSLEDLYIRLRPSGFLIKEPSGWIISKEAEKWLETQDDLYLAAFLNGNIKFFAEILALIKDEPKKIRDILQVATNEYRLNWKSKNEVLSRLKWLKDLNLINYEDFSGNYFLTDLGEGFISTVSYHKPEDLETFTDPTINETEVPISPWAWDMCKEIEKDAGKRKTGIGYFPGSFQTVHNTILDYLLMMNNPTDISTVIEYSSSTFGISESSTRAFISSLVNLDFVERKTKTLFQTSDLGRKFPSDNFELDFACCINHKFNFTFEILEELKKEDLSVKQLAVIGKVSHGFPSEKSSEVNKRLHILKNAKLIQETGVNLYCLTKRGENFYENLKPYIVSTEDRSIQQQSTENEIKNPTGIEALLNEIRMSSRDSSNPDRFEEALKNAFTLLGFKAEWLGGSGKTDILLQAPTSPKFAYIVAVDAKTTYSGAISESHINFDTLVDHRKKHNADFSLVVGREFQGERLINRATKHNVALLNIEELESLIKMHLEVPLKSDSYKKIFNQKGIVDTKVLEDNRSKVVRDGDLLRALMRCLSEESEDPLTEGIMQPREIYLLLKNHLHFTSSPTLEEIEQMLDFLSSPLIGCIGSTKEGYYAIGSLTDAEQTFGFYLKACRD
ncbi:hypothetical protein [Thalassobacillus pellis]|uniref:hypothetical protein n=1 Tax=Thalassobacillus pellis TaxID=748008 RepID=UPI00196133F0|nr:hypothetical protein [Thalassobacillus pellis]MBM7554903.1 putative transcriptional regulator [Thalassobacillus pellis]